MMRTQGLACLFVAISFTACVDESSEDPSEIGAGLKLPSSANPYTLFESLQVRPVALSPSGRFLFAANTPDNRLEIYKVDGGGLTQFGSVAVGLEPVAVAARSDNEVWVVNHLSDSVSVVKVSGLVATVTQTLLVGDEPRDIVFAGLNKSRAFITTAHRGQNTGDAYDLQTPGIGRADVWVFDANNLGTAPGGQRLAKLTLFADTPRALAASADGKTVYAAAFLSGNQTTSVSEYAVSQKYPNGMPGPATITVNGQPVPQPRTGLVVKFKDGHWVDPYGTVFDEFVKIKLPDYDVFAIDAMATPPKAPTSYAHVGTTLFNMAVNPQNGKVYVTNTEAHNDIRFEGHTEGFTTVRGRIADSRISVIDPSSGAVTPRDLNTHVDFTKEGSAAEKARSVAFPQDVAVSANGTTLYTVAQGSSRLAIYRTADIESGALGATSATLINLTGGGPTGVALDEARNRAYVLTRFDNSIKIVDLAGKKEIGKVAMFNPEPKSVVDGRKYLYDANLTSQHGTTSCASCHIGGDKDELAWDLGNPGGGMLPITKAGSVFSIPPAAIIQLLPYTAPMFDWNMPLKGPMTTQSLRGMDNHGAMHWRGDRNGAIQQSGAPFLDGSGQPIASAQPNAGIFDEKKAFTSFNVAFPGLIGRAAELSASDMNEFADFILQVMYPPNPIRNLDNSLTDEQKQGRDFYFNHNGTTELPSDRFHNCNGCHTLDLGANADSSPHPGFFGTDGRLSFEFETQIFKVPHLRNMYTKAGMFGSSPDSIQPGTLILQGPNVPIVDQVRGFGFQHDGSLGQLEHFFTGQVFLKATTNVQLGGGLVAPPNPFGIPFVDPNELGKGNIVFIEDGGFALRAAIVAFMYAFDTNFAPIVGQQITMSKANAAAVGPRLDLLEARATAGECDLIAKSTSTLGPNMGFLFKNGAWQAASLLIKPIADKTARAKIAAGEIPPVTITCVPPGSGQRLAIDRDNDGYADWDEVILRKDPNNPASHP